MPGARHVAPAPSVPQPGRAVPSDGGGQEEAPPAPFLLKAAGEVPVLAHSTV